jgi:acyl-CoA synthetase (AMP-forming)/AMP-acid ligase II
MMAKDPEEEALALGYSSEYELPNFRTLQWRRSPLDRTTEVGKMLHPTLVHALQAAKQLDEGVGVTVLAEKESEPAKHMTWREIYNDARRIANGLKGLGVVPGDRVLIVLPTCHEFLTVFSGIQMLGAIPVPAYPPSGFRVETGIKRLAHIARHSGSRVCVTWDVIEPLLGDIAHEARSLERVVDVKDLLGSRINRLANVKPESAAFIQYTSGSTGNPKGVLLSHRNLIANIHAMGQALQINRNDVLVGWCPLYHDMGLIGTFLSAIYWRLPLVLLPPTAFLTKPHRWLRAIHDYKGTISPAPNFGYALCVKRVKPAQRKDLDLSSWRVALNGAEPVTLNAVHEFTETYAPHGFSRSAMFPVYGLAESSLAVSFPDPGSPIRHMVVDRERLSAGRVVPARPDAPSATTLICVGKAIPGQGLRVVDEAQHAVPDLTVGHVITAGSSVMEGYFQDPDATADCMKDGWLWTGDLGFVAQGELYICGRAKDLIIVRGKNYHAEDLEQCAESVEGVRRGGCVAFGIFDEKAGVDRVVLVCETKLRDEDERRALKQRVAEVVIEGTGLPIDHVELVDPSSIPKTSSGKRQRRLCREAYIQGQLQPNKGSRLRVGLVYVRARAGMVRMQTRRLFSKFPPSR